MKKARIVEIPGDRRLSAEEYEELLKHAKNSASFYCGNGLKSQQQIIDKLTDKGYILDDVTVYHEGKNTESSENIINNVIDYLYRVHLLDENYMAEKIVESMLNKGKGAREIQRKMFEKKMDKRIIKSHMELLEDTDDENIINDALDTAVESYKRKTAYKRELDPRKRKQKLYAFLISRGFSISQIKEKTEDMELDDEFR